jgi:hypothetical protein
MKLLAGIRWNRHVLRVEIIVIDWVGGLMGRQRPPFDPEPSWEWERMLNRPSGLPLRGYILIGFCELRVFGGRMQ